MSIPDVDPDVDPDVALAATMVESFGAMFGAALVPIAVVRLGSGRSLVLDANDAFRTLLGRTDVVGLDLASVAGPDELVLGSETVERVRYGQIDLVGRRHNYRRSDGSTVTVHVFGIVLHRDDGGTLIVDFFVDPGRMDSLTRRFYREAEITAALAEVRAALLRGETTDVVLELICAWTRRLLGADNAGILQVVDDGHVALLATDRPGVGALAVTWPVVDDHFGRALRSGNGARYTVPREVIAATGADVTLPDDYEGELHVAVAPVNAAGARFGALVARRAVGQFDDAEMAVLVMFAEGVTDAMTVAYHRADHERLRVLEVRQQIARNLHDEVIQDLIGVRLALVATVSDTADLQTAARLESLRDELNAATMRLRDVVAGLEEAVSPAEFGDTLRAFTHSRALRHGIGWTVDLQGPLEEIGDDERAEVLRVLNEAVSNVVRHADATQVDMTLLVDEDRVRLVVEDDGIGPAGAADATGMGLRDVRARAGLRGGECTIGDRADGGTRLEWWIPRGPRR